MCKRTFTSFAIAATVAAILPAASAHGHAALNRNEHQSAPGLAHAIRAASLSRTSAPARALRRRQARRAVGGVYQPGRAGTMKGEVVNSVDDQAIVDELASLAPATVTTALNYT